MLPLIHTHQTVQTPLNPLDGLQGHGRQDYIFQYHSPQPRPPSYPVHSTTPRSFAIRTVQQPPPLHRVTTTFTRPHPHDHGAEHSLRRKTPSGTIDNGYDGSHLVSGPPPLKQMILPASSDIFPTAVVDRAATSSLGSFPGSSHLRAWPHGASGQTPKLIQNPDVGAPPRGWGLGPPTMLLDHGAADGTPRMPGMHHPNYHVAAGLHALMGPGYQQPLASPGFGHTGYPQSGAWRDRNHSDYRTAVPLANGYTPQNAVVDSAFMPTQSTVHHGFLNGLGIGQVHPFGPPLSSRPIDDGFARYGHPGQPSPVNRMEALTLSPATHPVTGPDAANRYKEWALHHAHAAYNELLVYLSHSKKAHHGQAGSGSRSTKMVVYPKLPKTFATSEGSRKLRAGPYAEPSASYSQHLAQKEAAARAAGFGGRVDPRDLVLGNAHGRAPVTNPSIAVEIISSPHSHMGPWFAKHHRGLSETGGSPSQNARASLDSLTIICEQTGWKWVDGMLLGGCLHYGLEHYDEALEWFKRIVNLEKRLVVRSCTAYGILTPLNIVMWKLFRTSLQRCTAWASKKRLSNTGYGQST